MAVIEIEKLLKFHFPTLFGKKQKSPEYKCEVCGAKYKTDQELTEHNEVSHQK
jgi:hypothetical protein